VSKKPDEMTVLEHLGELRRVLIVSIAATVILAGVAYYFCDRLLTVLLEPVTSLGHRIVFTTLTEAFFTKIKFSLFLGFFAALPVILWQVWSFIMPALKKNEKPYFTAFVFISYISFVGGVAFAFFGVYRFAISFLLQFAGSELVPMLTIGRYVSFTIWFLLPFGLIFELPLASFFLAKLGIVTHRFLAKSRKYAFLIVIVLAAALTPTPDLLTCLLMAGPMYLLFELSIWITRIVEKGKERRARQQELAELADAQVATKQ